MKVSTKQNYLPKQKFLNKEYLFEVIEYAGKETNKFGKEQEILVVLGTDGEYAGEWRIPLNNDMWNKMVKFFGDETDDWKTKRVVLSSEIHSKDGDKTLYSWILKKADETLQ